MVIKHRDEGIGCDEASTSLLKPSKTVCTLTKKSSPRAPQVPIESERHGTSEGFLHAMSPVVIVFCKRHKGRRGAEAETRKNLESRSRGIPGAVQKE